MATHSSGNHALSLSYAAGRRGIPCHVVMPRTAPAAKKAAVRGYGGTITECEPSTTSREAVFAEVHAATGADFVHPLQRPPRHRGPGHLFARADGPGRGAGGRDRPHRRRGHGVGLLPDAEQYRAACEEIYAAEPEQADDAYRSFKAGHINRR